MGRRKKTCVSMAVLLMLGLMACGGNEEAETGETQKNESEELVWVMTELDVQMNEREHFNAVIHNGAIYYIPEETESQVVCFSLATGEESVVSMNWPEKYADYRKWLSQIVFDFDNNLYVLAEIYLPGERNSRTHLCKFDAQGQMVYIHDIEEQIEEGAQGARSSSCQMEVDAQGRIYLCFSYKLSFFDENGKFKEAIRVIEAESGYSTAIYDMARNRDGRIYLYYPTGWGTQLAEVDYENAALINPQDIKSGKMLAFAPEDGFVISTGDELYSYSTDIPTVERWPKEEFVWWDYLINGDNLMQLSVTEEDKLLAIVFSSKQEFCHVVLAEQMPKAEAEEKAKQDERVRLKRE